MTTDLKSITVEQLAYNDHFQQMCIDIYKRVLSETGNRKKAKVAMYAACPAAKRLAAMAAPGAIGHEDMILSGRRFTGLMGGRVYRSGIINQPQLLANDGDDDPSGYSKKSRSDIKHKVFEWLKANDAMPDGHTLAHFNGGTPGAYSMAVSSARRELGIEIEHVKDGPLPHYKVTQRSQHDDVSVEKLIEEAVESLKKDLAEEIKKKLVEKRNR